MIADLGRRIDAELNGERAVFLTVMNGALMFAGQLALSIRTDLEFDYVHATRYRGETSGSELHWLREPVAEMTGRTVLLVDDILDEGETMAAIRDRILAMGAKRFLSAVLCEKQIAKAKPLRPDFCGFEVPDRYVFGCGMDAKGYWRNLPSIRALTDGA